MQIIQSINNDKIKETSFLKDRSQREEKQLFFFEGIHLFEEFVRYGNKPVSIFVTENAMKKYADKLTPFDDVLYEVSDRAYGKMSCEQSPQGVLCVAKYTDNILHESLQDKGGIILESVRDTGNLGTIIRTAVSLGINGITVSNDCADLFSPKTVRASMGAVFAVDINITNDVCCYVRRLKENGNRVFAACLYGETQTLGRFETREDDVFVLGNEGNGVTEYTASECTSRVIIPMSGKTESLNVAAAATIIMWEMARKSLK